MASTSHPIARKIECLRMVIRIEGMKAQASRELDTDTIISKAKTFYRSVTTEAWDT